ncbi:CTP synthase, partial [Escherichia coli]
LYSIPLDLQKQGLDKLVCEHMKLDCQDADMTEWTALVDKVQNLSKQVTIGLVGKYVELQDAYISVVESLRHAGYAFDADVQIKWINAEEVTAENIADFVQDVDGIIVPGGFGDRGVEGKIIATQYARENKVPF